MAFTPAHVGGAPWALNEKLTSTQISKLDADHILSLDKSTAGDTLSGVIAVAGTGQISANVSGAITPTVLGGVTSNVLGGVNATALGGIQSAFAGGISSSVVGGIVLSGGATDYPTFSAPRTRTTRYSPASLATNLPAGWSVGTPSFILPVLIGPGTTQLIYITIPAPINGSTLSTLTMYFDVPSAHTGVPAVLPGVRIFRVGLTSPGGTTLDSGALQTFTPVPATGAAWYAADATQSWVYTANQNNTLIDTSLYSYLLMIQDENGANAIAGNRFSSFTITYTNIVDMRPT